MKDKKGSLGGKVQAGNGGHGWTVAVAHSAEDRDKLLSLRRASPRAPLLRRAGLSAKTQTMTASHSKTVVGEKGMQRRVCLKEQ